jgi:hypothetical protein
LDNVRIRFVGPLEPLRGDINGNGSLTIEDLDELSVAVWEKSTDLAYDVNDDGSVNELDRTRWVTDVRGTVFGDANLDGEFNSTDLVQVLQIGEYADDVPLNSTWSDGDFGGDREFDTDDLVLALQTGAYETGPVAARAIPEPLSVVLFLNGGIWFLYAWSTKARLENDRLRRTFESTSCCRRIIVYPAFFCVGICSN